MLTSEAESFATYLFSAYPEVSLREETRQIYVRFFVELNAESVSSSLAELVRSSTRLPTIADVRRRIAEDELDLPTPHEAYHSVFESEKAERHPLTRYVVDIFGGEFNIRTDELPAAMRSQFLKLYEELRDETVRRGELPRSVVAATSAKRPLEDEQPVQPTVWTAIRARFDALSKDEQTKRVREARKRLLKNGEVSADWLVKPVIEHEALRLYGEENGWLEQEAS